MHRLLIVLVTVSVLCSGCTGEDPARVAPPDRSAGSTPSVPPLPPPPTAAERLGLRTGWGPSRSQLERAARAVGRLPLASLAGQVIVADWSGTEAPVRLVGSLHLGGVIAFADNVDSTRQIRAANRELVDGVQRRWPLFLAVDQEGGIVQRIQADATRFPALMTTGAARDSELTETAARAMGAELRGLGFTVDLAPVADVTVGPVDPAIGSRSVGSDPALVAEHVAAAATGLARAGVLPVLKHFPGHGSVPTDSHVTLPVQVRSRGELGRSDLVPFRRAIAAGAPAVMTGHLDLRAVDPGVPSSMSRRVVTGLLRRELGFAGLVVTDSLQMAGARPGRDGGAAQAVRALRAGNDVLLMPPDPAAARRGIIAAVREGSLPRRRLAQAAARQIALLLDLRDGRGRPPGSGRAASYALSAAALTVTDGPCRGRLVGAAVSPVGDGAAVAVFAEKARAAGLEVLLSRPVPVRLREIAKQERREARIRRWQRQERARVAAGTSVGLMGYGDGPVVAQVAVALDTPYVLGRSVAPVRIATYGATPGAMRALVEVLLGDARARGRLPVAVAGVARRGC